MGWAKRSRRFLPPGTICYLCGESVADGQKWNRDHVPPQRMYGKSIRQEFNPNLDWLPTHVSCNSAYREDEEYTVTALAGHAQTLAARSVFQDIQRGNDQGHFQGLLKTIVGQFGKVELPDGSVVFHYDVDRVGRFVWKLVRGLYFGGLERVLPENVPKRLILVDPSDKENPTVKYPFFQPVRDTESLGRHRAVFDYKWLGMRFENGIRGHLVAMLLWDRLIVLAIFHDPSCACAECVRKGDVPVGEGTEQDKAFRERGRQAPADDPPPKASGHERSIDEAAPCRDGHPEPIPPCAVLASGRRHV